MEFSEIGASVARLSAVIGVGRLAAFVLLPAALRTVSGGQASSDDRASSSDNLWSVFFHSYVTYLAVLGAWELGATPQERWTSQSDASATAGLLICADNLMQLPVQFRKKVPLSKTWTVLAHHVAQTGVFLLALHTGRCHYWGALATISEATNPPISVLFGLKECGAPTSGMTYTAASIGCWLSFVAFRMVLYPTWLAAFAWDLVHHPAVSFESTSRLELVLYPLVMLIMLLLSVAWFVPLSQGTAKVWRERSWAARAELLSDPKTD